MKTICLYFEIHQPVHLKRYRFFEIGKDHYYYDDYENERAIRDTADNSYVPALTALLDMCKQNDNFKCCFSLSGVAIEMLEQYAPEVIDLLQQIAETGKADFLAEPYSHGLASLGNEEIFKNERRVTLPDFYARLAHAGAPLYQRKLGVSIPEGERVALYDREGFFALAQSVRDEDEPMLRSLRLFRL